MVLDELECHLRDDIEQQMRSGAGAAEAFAAAVQRTGEAVTLKREFDNITEAKAARRRNDLWRAFGIGAGFLLASVAVCTCVFFPLGLRASEQYALRMGLSVSDWRSGAVLGFLCRLVVGSTLSMTMPVGLLALAKVGLLDWRKLAGYRRHVIVANLFVAAVVTTPEVVTQVMMFIPLQLLFEASVAVARFWERDNRTSA